MSNDLITQAKFAAEVGISRSAVNQLIKKGKLPLVNGKIPLKEGLAAYRLIGSNGTNQTSEATGDVANLAVATKKAELVEKNFKAKLRQLEYEERKGQLISIEVVKQDASRVAALLRTAILSLPSRLALQLEMKEAGEIQAILENELNAVLTKLHDTRF